AWSRGDPGAAMDSTEVLPGSDRGGGPAAGRDGGTRPAAGGAMPLRYADSCLIATNEPGGKFRRLPARYPSVRVVDLLQAVHRDREAGLAGLELQGQVQRVVPGLMQVAAVEPQPVLLGRLPHVALLALPRAGILAGVRAQPPALADLAGHLRRDQVGG